ncbi:hypothetical protein Bca4012_064454 [Brassica carinata]
MHGLTLYNSKYGNSIELVLVDSSDTRLHASIENDLVQKHRHLLNEDQALSINAFSLKEYSGDFKTSSFPFKLDILRTTRTKELTDFPDDVPEKYFIDFGDILDGKYERNLLIVGNVEEVKTKGKSNNSSKLQLILRDTNEVTFKCTLWGGSCKTYICSYHQEDAFGCGEISISNAFSATKILFDPNTEQADHFRNSLRSTRHSITQGAFKQISHGNSVDVRTEFFSRNPRKTLNGIDSSKNWYYWACKRCNLKVQEYGEFSDDDGSQPKYNYKILIFDQIVENLLGKSAENFMREYDELDHIPVYPELLDSIVGKRVLFKVTLKGKNNKFVNSPLVVDCVLEDEDMIDEWLANSSESLQLTSGEDCSESSFAEIQTPGSKNDNQAIVVEDQRSFLLQHLIFCTFEIE